MYPEVSAELARRGLVTRRFAIKYGMVGPEVDRLVRIGTWTRVWRGVYVATKLWDELDEHVGRPLWRSRAASAHLLVPHVMSHDSAALELGLSVLEAQAQPVHITRFGVVGTRHEEGITQHKAPHRPEQIVFPEGRPVLHAARTAVDVARCRGFTAGLVTADSALAAGVPRSALREVLEHMVCWPGSRTARRVVEMADAGADSPGETLTREVLVEMGHVPESQVGLQRDGRTAWCDLRVGRLVIEFDGRQKYGVDVADPAALWEEKKREDFVRSLRLGVSRVVWSDLFGANRNRLKERLARDLAAVEQSWGHDVTDLRSYQPTRARRRPRRSRPALWPPPDLPVL